MTSMTPLEKKAIDTMRALAMDAVQQAKSGHPGAPMALAPIAYMLYNERMNYDPKRPNWPNRDRFIPFCTSPGSKLFPPTENRRINQRFPSTILNRSVNSVPSAPDILNMAARRESK